MNKPLTLLRRTWIVPSRYSREDCGRVPDGEDDWGTIQSARVVVERGQGHGGVSELYVFRGENRIMGFERNHPQFREWMSELIHALTEAMNEPLDVLSLTQEHFEEGEEKLQECLEHGVLCDNGTFTWPGRECPSRPEQENIVAYIPAGAHPIRQPQKLDVVWHLPGAVEHLRPWRGRPSPK